MDRGRRVVATASGAVWRGFVREAAFGLAIGFKELLKEMRMSCPEREGISRREPGSAWVHLEGLDHQRPSLDIGHGLRIRRGCVCRRERDRAI